MTTSPPTTQAAAAPVGIYPLRDVMTMLRRNIKDQFRDKVAVVAIIGIPTLFLLLFNYVFGGALKGAAGVAGTHDHNYVDYLLPGLIIMTAASQLIGTSTSTSVDMTGGIFTRLRTMAIYTPSLLFARVLSSVIQAVASMAVVFGIAFLMGFSPDAGALRWVALCGFLAYISFALCWLGLAFGLAAKSVASASNGPFPLVLLPLIGSGIVPPRTMPAGVRYFAEYQPFTPMTDTLRSLLFGTHVGHDAVIALAWATGLGIVGIVWSVKAFNRDRPERPS